MALNAEQRRNAAVIAKVGRQMGASKRDIQIALSAALTESSLLNVDHGDASGPDSRGLFQQRNGWGSAATRMDPAGSSKLFYQALFKVKNRAGMEPWMVAQSVQRSAYSDGSNYRKNWALGQSAYGGAIAVDPGSGGGTMPEGTAPVLSAQDLAENYGFAMAFLKAHKDVYGVFQKAVAGTWAPEKFVAQLKTTGWWKTTANSVRQYQIQKASDPATLGQRRLALNAQIRDSASSIGASLSNKQAQRVTENALMFGWNDSQIRDTLSQYVHTMNGIYNGQTGTDTDALKQTAWRNGVRLSTATLQTWAQQMAKGNVSPTYYQDSIRKMARTVAPGFAQELDSGMDLYDIANPYIESKAKLLQLDPAKVDLFDPDIRAALSAKDAKTGQPTSKSLWEFENDIRKNPEYLKTDAARDQAYGVGHQVLRDMGLIGQ